MPTTLLPATTVTVGNLITNALRAIAVFNPFQTPGDAQITSAMGFLNSYMDTMTAYSQWLHVLNRQQFTLTAGHNPHTIGNGADLDTNVPSRIRKAAVEFGGLDYNVDLVDAATWLAAPDKGMQVDPIRYIWFDGGFPIANLFMWPVPNSACLLTLITEQPYTRFSDTATVIEFPPGYEEMFTYGLAMRLAPQYGVTPSTDLLRFYKAAEHGIKARNVRIPALDVDIAIQSRRSGYDILSDWS